jgi:hypothetical protein
VNGPETFEVMSEEEQIEKLVQMVIGLDAGVDQLGAFYVALSQDLEKLTNAQGLSNQMSEHKVNFLRRMLCSKPDHLKTDIESPTVWGAFMSLGYSIAHIVWRLRARSMKILVFMPLLDSLLVIRFQ